MSIAKVLQQVKLPGEKMIDLMAQSKELTESDKATLVRWYEEEQNTKGAAK